MVAERPLLTAMSLEELAWLVYAEYTEMPGTRLTFEQARRLFALSVGDCRRVLDDLVDRGFLIEDSAHRFCRNVDVEG